MKQNFTHKGLARLYFIMRVSLVNLVFLAITSLQVITAKSAHGQTAEHTFVNIDEQHISLKDLFTKIEEQTNFLFVYAPEVIDEYQDVSITGGRRTVADVLNTLFIGKSIVYSESGLNIIIKRHGDAVSVMAESGKSNAYFRDLVRINGKVVDIKGDPLPGVNVIVKGTTIGTTTGADGYYSIDVPFGSNVIVFSFIGFKSQELNINTQTEFNITLYEDVMSLAEVEVRSTGYWTDTKAKSTGSIVKVTSKEIERQPVTNPLMALQGRVAGLEITPQGGMPGVAPTIRIRGTNSLRSGTNETNGNYPLYVIDGVPVNSAPISSYTNSYTSTGFDPISTINPANIASIEILKDGDATAIYGSRGANGVVIITTKNPKPNDKANIDLSAYSGIGAISRRIQLLGTHEYLSMRREALTNDRLIADQYDYDLKYWDTTRHTNWQKVLLGGTANVTDAQASISAGATNTSFRFGGGYHKETLIFPGNFGYHRVTGNVSLNHVSDNDKFKASMTANYGIDNSNLFNDTGGIVNAALTLPPFAPRLYNDDGTLNWEVHDLGGTSRSTWINPMSFTLNRQKVVTNNLVTNATLAYEIIPQLHVSGNVGYTNLNSDEFTMYPKSAASPETAVTSGTVTFNTNKRSSWIIEPKINFTKTIKEHEINVLAGATWQSSTSDYNIVAGSQYTSDALLGSLKGAGLIESSRDEVTDYRYMSIYSRIGYVLSGKYLLNLTGRRDGSSRFGPGNRFGNFGALGIGWIFSDEEFMKNSIPFINFGKIRTSFGVTGSDQIGDYAYYSLYEVYPQSYQGVRGLQPSSLLNRNFKWEVTEKLEAAIELGLFDDRLGLEVNWYRNRSSNQLVNYPLSVITGFPSVLTNFNATIDNSGWEVSVRADLMQFEDWSWRASANISLPNNKLVKFDGIENSPYAEIYKVGAPLYVKSVYHFIGINPDSGLYDFEDTNNDGLINETDKSPVNLQPRMKYFGGISNTIRYKEFELSFLLQFSHQNLARLLSDMPGRAGVNQPSYVLQRWQQSGDQTDVQRYSTINASENSYKRFLDFVQSDHNVTAASFIRLKTLSLGYELPGQLIKAVHLIAAKVFVQGQNLFAITPYDGLDPETGNTLPPLRMLTIGLQITL
ncbi:SusC/RagA family TonB-linked outer membrane protein [Dawidia soli]|uniref:SusC/RagA family TonB-linked outer membrane protein n=1 Tax=Dawidia soli TaxID=2782352 RepID=A0AAP2DA80_9BACT|nr:SusC/RagA family TonB-linked outer membrane protein [Dawidia soli]MBT1688303.1 SusC/RagA family TonB-linked outer membrane protein [Dawidia soli]